MAACIMMKNVTDYSLPLGDVLGQDLRLSARLQ
jgi:hypothetical protein